MSDSFVVLNPTHNQVSLVFDPPFTMQDELHMSKHKRRRKVRGGITVVSIAPNTSVDLVARTTYESSHLEKNEDLQKFFRLGILKDMRRIDNEVVNSPVVEVKEEIPEILPEEEKEEVEAIDEAGQEETLAEPTERVEEPVAAPKKQKRKKGRRKKAEV